MQTAKVFILLSADVDFAILIPAYQPDGRMLLVVDQLWQACGAPIVVVDDGSATSPLFEQLKSLPAVHVVHHAVNLGKGAAIKTGLNYILVHFPKLSAVVTVDADGQHATKDVLRVVESSQDHRGQLILGARCFGAGTPWRSRIGNATSKLLYRALLGLRLSDTQTGLRAIPRTLAEYSLHIRSNRYEFETEQLVLAASNGTPIHEIPIQTIYENGNASSHFSPIFDSARIYFVVVRYALSSGVTALVDLLHHSNVTPMSGRCGLARSSSSATPRERSCTGRSTGRLD
jgi:glycosyltransferase involved in cell wall biosynthesis